MRLLILLSSLVTLPCPAALVAYWNFNELSITSADTPGSGEVPSSITASQGSGMLDLSTWSGTVDDFSGSTTNTLEANPAEESLSLIAGSGNAGNGSSIVLQFSLSGMWNPSLSFATQGTATGFTSNQLAWSLNNIDFTDFGATYAPDGSYAMQSFELSSVDALDGASNVWLRLSFDGATGSAGNNRIDNMQITAIPESSSLALLSTGTLILLWRRRKSA